MHKILLVHVAALVLLSLGTGLAHDSDSVTVQVGAGQDTTVVSSYFPSTLRVKVGETVTFRLAGDEPHTVTFLGDQPRPFPAVRAEDGSGEMYFNPMVAFPTRRPGGPVESHDGSNYLNSGMMTHQPTGPDAPPNDTMAVTFAEAGTYEYYCLLHPWMKGIVIVEPEASATALSHEEIDAQAQAEAGPLLALAESIPHQPFGRSEPGPNGTTTWYVNAGAVDIASADPRAASFEFLPTDLSIKAGDTIVWTSPEFHTVSFAPVPPGPTEVIVRPQEQGPPQLVLNPEVWQPVKPDGTYQPAQYFNSGILGPYTPNGYSWSLTFDQPGTYEYYCALHRAMGMEGTITVQAR